MRRAVRLAMIALSCVVMGVAAYNGHWRVAAGALGVAVLEAFWLVRPLVPLRIKRKPLHIRPKDH